MNLSKIYMFHLLQDVRDNLMGPIYHKTDDHLSAKYHVFKENPDIKTEILPVNLKSGTSNKRADLAVPTQLDSIKQSCQVLFTCIQLGLVPI